MIHDKYIKMATPRFLLTFISFYWCAEIFHMNGETYFLDWRDRVCLSTTCLYNHRGICCQLIESKGFNYVRWRRISLPLVSDRCRAFLLTCSFECQVLWLIDIPVSQKTTCFSEIELNSVEMWMNTKSKEQREILEFSPGTSELIVDENCLSLVTNSLTFSYSADVSRRSVAVVGPARRIQSRLVEEKIFQDNSRAITLRSPVVNRTVYFRRWRLHNRYRWKWLSII